MVQASPPDRLCLGSVRLGVCSCCRARCALDSASSRFPMSRGERWLGCLSDQVTEGVHGHTPWQQAHRVVVSGLFGRDVASNTVNHFPRLIVQLTPGCTCVSVRISVWQICGVPFPNAKYRCLIPFKNSETVPRLSRITSAQMYVYIYIYIHMVSGQCLRPWEGRVFLREPARLARPGCTHDQALRLQLPK